MSERPQNDLILGFLRGNDEDARTKLIKLLTPTVMAMFLRGGVRREDVDDEIQELWWYLVRKAKPSQLPYFERRWRKVLKCMVASYHRRQKKRGGFLLPYEEEATEEANPARKDLGDICEANSKRDEANRDEMIDRSRRGEGRRFDEKENGTEVAKDYLVELALMTYPASREDVVRYAVGRRRDHQ